MLFRREGGRGDSHVGVCRSGCELEGRFRGEAGRRDEGVGVDGGVVGEVDGPLGEVRDVFAEHTYLPALEEGVDVFLIA